MQEEDPTSRKTLRRTGEEEEEEEFYCNHITKFSSVNVICKTFVSSLEKKGFIMKKFFGTLLAAFLLSSGCAEGMRPQKIKKTFSIICFDKEFQVSKKVINQFDLFKTEQHLYHEAKTEKYAKKIKTKEKLEIKKKKTGIGETLAKSSMGSRLIDVKEPPSGFSTIFEFTNRTIWNPTHWLQEEFKPYSPKEKFIGIAEFKPYSPKEKFIGIAEFRKQRKKQITQEQLIHLFDLLLQIASEDLKANEAGNETTLFLLIKMADALRNETVQEKCTQAFMEKILGGTSGFMEARTLPMESTLPGIYPMGENLFLFKENLSVLLLFDERMEKVISTFEKKQAFRNVAPLNKKEFLSQNSDSTKILLWKINNPEKEIREFPTNGYPIPINENTFIVKRGSYSIIIWNKNQKEPKYTSLMDSEKILPSFSNQNKILTTRKKDLYLYEIPTFEEISGNTIKRSFTFRTKKEIKPWSIIDAAIIPNSNMFLSVCHHENLIHLWRLDQQNPIAEFKTKKPVKVVAINETSFCSRSKSPNVLVWDINQPTPIQTLVHKKPVQAMAVMPGGQLLTYAGGELYTWDLLEKQDFTFQQVELLFRVFVQDKQVDIGKSSDDYDTFASLPRAIKRKIEQELGKKEVEMEEM